MNAIRTKLLPKLIVLLLTLNVHHIARAWYDPGLQRWINRDPFGEVGFETQRRTLPVDVWPALRPGERFEGPNIYAFVNNNPDNRLDAYGLSYTLRGGGYSNPWNTGSYTCRRGATPDERKRLCFLGCSAICSGATSIICAGLTGPALVGCITTMASGCALTCGVACGYL